VGRMYSAIFLPVFLFTIWIEGCTLLSADSVMTGCFMRVFSSRSMLRVTPSRMPLKATMPASSARMKSANGSHSKMGSLTLTFWLFLTMTAAP